MTIRSRLTINGRVMKTQAREGAPQLVCNLKLKQLKTATGGVLQPTDPSVSRGDFEKTTRTEGAAKTKGNVRFANMPHQVEVGGEIYFPVYDLEVLNPGRVVVVIQVVDAAGASAPVGKGANHEWALGDLNVDDRRLEDPFLRSKAELIRGRAVPLEEVTAQELQAEDPTQHVYAYYAADVDIPDLQERAALESELRQWPQDKRPDWKKDFDASEHEFVTTATAQYWRAPKVIETDKNVRYTNDGFEWLTYETVLNKPKFRKSNQPLEYGLYTLPFADVDVFLRARVPPAVLDALAAAFFPDQQPNQVQAASNAYWPWKNRQYQQTSASQPQPQAPVQIQLGGVGGQINDADIRVVLPYNYCDNNLNSCAIGTEPTALPHAKQIKNAHWKYWKTASRSSVVKLERVKDAGTEWRPREEKPWRVWPYWKGVDQRQHVKLADDIGKGQELKTASLGPSYVSLKTGVCYVGMEDQSLAVAGKDSCKDFIDANWIVSILRSDYVAETEAEVGKSDDRLLVLTELLSITERTPRTTPDAGLEVNDGVQVRDLSRLQKDRAYIFPGSIPYLGTDYKTLASAFSAADEGAWCAHWKLHWAAGLGRAKALFLLQYGLQHINPNPQNYLIEFTKRGSELGALSRVVIRDLQDASLHREVAWALFGKKDQPPPVTTSKDEIRPLLHAAFKAAADGSGVELPLARILQHEFEVENKDSFQETGTTSDGFGGPGTKLAWSLFSAGVALTKAQWLKALEAEVGTPPKVDLVINLLADWGLAHAITYVRTLEDELGVELRKIEWKRFPNFDAGKDIVTEETAATSAIHSFLSEVDGQNALRAYRKGGWKQLKPPLETLTLMKAGSKWPWSIVRFESSGVTWYRPTNEKATISIYEPLSPDTAYTLLHWRGQYRRKSGRTDLLEWLREEKWIETPLVKDGSTLQIPP